MLKLRMRTKFLLSMLLISAGLTCTSLLLVRHGVQKQIRREICSQRQVHATNLVRNSVARNSEGDDPRGHGFGGQFYARSATPRGSQFARHAQEPVRSRLRLAGARQPPLRPALRGTGVSA